MIGGVDIAAGVDDQQFTDLRDAFIEHGVIFLRDQHITPDQHLDFARRWGGININRFFRPVDGHPMIAEVRKEPHQVRNIGTRLGNAGAARDNHPGRSAGTFRAKLTFKCR